jgi:hypothetical protein
MPQISVENRTVTIHPESRGNVICFELDGFVSQEDHRKFLIDPLRTLIKEHGTYRVIMVYKPGFEGWQPGAAEDNLEIVLECAPVCERAAYVNPPKKKILQMKLSKPMIKFEIRYFETDQFDEALAWIRQ